MRTEKWDARIRRARELASEYSFAVEALRFYEHVAQFQKSLYADIESQNRSSVPRNLLAPPRAEIDLFLLLPRFAAFLSVIERNGPAPLSQSAAELRAAGSPRWREILTEFWQAGPDTQAESPSAEKLIAWIFLQPYAQFFADRMQRVPNGETPSLCPVCGSKPQLAVLRPEGEGAKRSLVCGLCATEWNYRRIVCPSCGEEDVHKLAVYTADEFKHVRVDACETCRSYIKTVDLTKDGRAVPDVDELATIPLNLWATEHGYGKSHTNIIGI
ncbi:MAG TPA: formate dehydrogenase accessory protein FdhE [Candidatus Acidoferrum sp.]|nr:formate dehydrogenase accessory protein FdhE [Candidatus Acidoferrum sp.]